MNTVTMTDSNGNTADLADRTFVEHVEMQVALDSNTVRLACWVCGGTVLDRSNACDAHQSRKGSIRL